MDQVALGDGFLPLFVFSSRRYRPTSAAYLSIHLSPMEHNLGNFQLHWGFAVNWAAVLLHVWQVSCYNPGSVTACLAQVLVVFFVHSSQVCGYDLCVKHPSVYKYVKKILFCTVTKHN